jgi:hypothetical protein
MKKSTDTTKKKKSAPKTSKRQPSTPSQFEKYPALTDRQIKSVQAIGWLEEKRANIFLTKGAFWCIVILLVVFTACSIIAGFMGNVALAGVFGGTALISAITAGANKLFAKAFGENSPPFLGEKNQKLLEEKKKAE